MSAKKIKNLEKKSSLVNFIEPPQDGKWFSRNIWFIVAFFVPFLFMYVCFAISKVAPFGDQQILATDLWHQYYPFLVDFQDKLQEGGSLLWTWKSGGGTNYIALMAYYLASPLNFLSVLVPAQYLREFLAVITCAKIGAASLFFAMFLNFVFKKRDITVVGFGTMYALCAFVMGYYWNVIWLDTIALLPLVVAGTILVLRDNKFGLYVSALALSVLANYYIGLFTCIFVVMVCIAYSIIEFKGIKKLGLDFVKMLSFSALAMGITAILTVPTALALGSTHSSDNTFPTTYAINIGDTADFAGTMQAFAKVISNSIAFVEPTTKEGLPNIYCGTVALVLGILFFTCSKIKIRERIAAGVTLLFFIMSFIIRQLDFIWHGFHFPNMLPHRFSFLFSFVLVVMAFRVFMYIKDIKLYQIGIALVPVVAIIITAFVIEKKTAAADAVAAEYWPVIATAFLVCLIAIWLVTYSVKNVSREALALVLTIICVAEGACSAYIGVDTVGVTTKTSYPLGTTDTLNVVDKMKSLEGDNQDLYRAEVTKYHSLNDNALIGIDGISMFSSVVNRDITTYMEKFGICGWVASNRYTYQESSPFTNMMLNIKYLISPNGTFFDTDHLTLAHQSGSVKLLKNEYYVPQGFMVSEDLLNFDISTASANPFDNQNRIFSLATGLEGSLYEPLEVVSQGHTSFEVFNVTKNSYGNYSFNLIDQNTEPHLKFNYTAPYDGTAYGYFQCGEGENVEIKINDNTIITNYVKRPYIMQMGTVKEGDKLSLYSNLKDATVGSAQAYCNMFNEELFQKGREKLLQSTLKCTKSTDTRIEGTIDVKEDGLFYTSISYDKGWKAFVDGEEVEITPVCDALVAFKLDAGHHDIVMKYCPSGFVLGVIITVVSLALFIGLFVLSKKKGFMKKREDEETVKAKK